MGSPKILIVPGSKRTGSLNTKLATVIEKELNSSGAQATAITLADYEMPLYDGDLEEASGAPENAKKLASLISEHHGVVLVNPEYNGSFSALMKNTLDWLSRNVGLDVYQGRVFALAACSPGGLGGIRVLSHARDNLVSVGADIITPQLAVGNAYDVIGDDGTLNNERSVELLQKMCETLIERARHYI